MDNSPSGPNNFALSLATDQNGDPVGLNNDQYGNPIQPSSAPNTMFLQTQSGNYVPASNVIITQLNIGQVYPTCTGSFVMPFTRALATGQYYSARVFANNEIG